MFLSKAKSSVSCSHGVAILLLNNINVEMVNALNLGDIIMLLCRNRKCLSTSMQGILELRPPPFLVCPSLRRYTFSRRRSPCRLFSFFSPSISSRLNSPRSAFLPEHDLVLLVHFTSLPQNKAPLFRYLERGHKRPYFALLLEIK